MKRIIKYPYASGKLHRITISDGAVKYYNYLYENPQWHIEKTVEDVTRALSCTSADMALWEEELKSIGCLEEGTDSGGEEVVYLGHPECTIKEVIQLHEDDLEEYRAVMALVEKDKKRKKK